MTRIVQFYLYEVSNRVNSGYQGLGVGRGTFNGHSFSVG